MMSCELHLIVGYIIDLKVWKPNLSKKTTFKQQQLDKRPIY